MQHVGRRWKLLGAALLALLQVGCMGGNIRWVKPLPDQPFTISKSGIYEIQAPRPKGATCSLYQDKQILWSESSQSQKHKHMCQVYHYLQKGTYRFKVKLPKKPKPKKWIYVWRQYGKRKYKRLVKNPTWIKWTKEQRKEALRQKQAKAKGAQVETKAKEHKERPKTQLLAYAPHQLGTNQSLSAWFRKRPATGVQTKLRPRPFVPLQTVYLKVAKRGLYHIEATGVTNVMQLYRTDGILIAESRAGMLGKDCTFSAFLKPGQYPILLRSQREGHFQFRTTEIPLRPMQAGQTTKGTLPAFPKSVAHVFQLDKRTLLQLDIHTEQPLFCDLYHPDGQLLTRFKGDKGCRLSRPLDRGHYALHVHANQSSPYTSSLTRYATQALSPGKYKRTDLRKGQPALFRFEVEKADTYVILSRSQTRPRFAVYNSDFRRVSAPVKVSSYFYMYRLKLLPGTHYIRMMPTREATEQSEFLVASAAQLPTFGSKSYYYKSFYRRHAFQLYRLKVTKPKSYNTTVYAYPSYKYRRYSRFSCALLDANFKFVTSSASSKTRCQLQAGLKPGTYFIYTIMRITLPKSRKRQPKKVLASLTTTSDSKGKPPKKPKTKGTNKTPQAATKAPSQEPLTQLLAARYRMSFYLRSTEEYTLKLTGTRSKTWKEIALSKRVRVRFRFYNKEKGLYIFETQSKGIDPICYLRRNQLVGKTWKYAGTVGSDNNSGEGKNCRLLAQLEPGYYTYYVRSYRYNTVAGNKLTANLKRVKFQTKPLMLGVPSPAETIGDKLHLYTIDVKKAAFYQLLTAGYSDPNCSLYNEKFYLVSAHRDNIPGRDLNCTLSAFLSPGRYQLMIGLGNRYFAKRPYRVLWRPFQFDPERQLQPGSTHVSGPLLKGEPHIYLIRSPQAGYYKIETTGASDPYCMLYSPDFEVLARHAYIHSRKNRNCRLIVYLPRGQYLLRLNLYSTRYKNRPYEVTMQPYPTRRLVPEKALAVKSLQGRAPRLFSLKIRRKGLYRIQTWSGRFVSCVLYKGTTQKIASHPWYGCSITRQLKPGQYTLRVNFSRFKPIKGGLRLLARIIKPRMISPRRTVTLPSLNKDVPTLLQVQIPRDGFYQFSSRGDARSRCELFQSSFKRLLKSSYYQRRCTLASRLKKGTYYLRIKPYYRSDVGKTVRFAVARAKPEQLAIRRMVKKIVRGQRSLFFQVTIKQAGFYQFKAAHRFSAYCKLYGKGLKPLKTVMGSYRGPCQVMQGLKPGRYTLQLKPNISYYYRKKAYPFGLQVLRRTPQKLRLQAATVAKRLARQDLHYYSFRPTKSGLYLFSTTGKSDPKGALLNDAYQTIATATDIVQKKRRGGLLSSSAARRSLDYNFMMEAYLVKGQTYYLRVKAQRSWIARKGRYRLTLRGLRKLVSDLPIKRTLTAAALQPGQPHYYKLTISKGGRYLFSTQGVSDPNCTLFDDRTHQLDAHKNVSSKNLNCRISRKLRAGTYIFRVELGSSRKAGSPYTLEVEQISGRVSRRAVATQSGRTDTAPPRSSDTPKVNDNLDQGNQKANIDSMINDKDE